MKITFIYINDYLADSLEIFDMAIISRYLESNGYITYIDRYRYSSTAEDIFVTCHRDSEFIGFYLFDYVVDLVFELSEKLKQYNPHSTIFLFGPIASLAAEEILQDSPHIDGIVLGDAENVLLDIIKRKCSDIPLSNSKCWYDRSDNRFFKEYSLSEIGKLPLPSVNNRSINMITSRGCYGNCSFCIQSNFYYRVEKIRWIGMNAEQIFCQIKSLYDQAKVYYISFYDRCFSDPPGKDGKKKLIDLCDMLISYHKPIALSCLFRADSFREADEHLVSQLRKAGFIQVNIGIESASQEDLVLFNKGTTVIDNENAIILFERQDIEVIIDFIMFHPLSTIESIKKNIDFLHKNNVCRLDTYFSRLRLYYKSDLYHFFRRNGYIDETFSYKNTFQYSYANKHIGEGVQFLEQWFANNSDMLHEQKRFLDFSEMVNICRAIFPDTSKEAVKALSVLKRKIANQIYSFFVLVFIKQKLEVAEYTAEEQAKLLKKLYQSHVRIKINLFKNAQIMEFFR